MAHTFQPGDLAVVESPVFHAGGTDVLKEHRHHSLKPGAIVRVHGPSSVRPDAEVVIDLADNAGRYRGCWRILTEGLIALADVEPLAAQRASLAAGDRVVVTSPVYTAGGVTREFGPQTVALGDTAVVHSSAIDRDGDIYVRMERDDRLYPIAREGLAPVEAVVLRPAWEPAMTVDDLPAWEDLDEDSRRAVEQQDAEEEAGDVRAWAAAEATAILTAAYADLDVVELDDEAFARAIVTLATYIEKGA